MKSRAYRVYVTDVLQAATKNTAKAVNGLYIADRWFDLIRPQPKRTGEEIAAEVIKKAGLKVVNRAELI